MPQDSCAELALPGGAMRYDPQRLAHPGSFLFDPRAPANDAVPVGVDDRLWAVAATGLGEYLVDMRFHG